MNKQVRYRRRPKFARKVSSAAHLPNNHEGLKNISASIQSLCIAIGIIVSGVWALYRFNQLENVDARVRLEEEERKKFSIGNLEISLNLDKSIIEGQTRYVYGSLMIKNVGSKLVTLHLRDQPIFIAKLVANELGDVTLSNAARFSIAVDPELIIKSEEIRSQRTIEFPILLKTDSSGFYLISFSTPTSVEDLIKEQEVPGGHDWLFSKIVHID
jgi:hypothetical protein